MSRDKSKWCATCDRLTNHQTHRHAEVIGGAFSRGERVRDGARLGSKIGTVVGDRAIERNGRHLIAVEFDGDSHVTLAQVNQLTSEAEA